MADSPPQLGVRLRFSKCGPIDHFFLRVSKDTRRNGKRLFCLQPIVSRFTLVVVLGFRSLGNGPPCRARNGDRLAIRVLGRYRVDGFPRVGDQLSGYRAT